MGEGRMGNYEWKFYMGDAATLILGDENEVD
jgi:hypothetical protein